MKDERSRPAYELKTLGDQLDQTLLTDRLIAMLSAGFGMPATLLAAVGLYGVMAFVVALGGATGAAISLGHYVSTQLYGMKTNDPWLAIGTMGLLTAVAAVAGLRSGLIEPFKIAI